MNEEARQVDVQEPGPEQPFTFQELIGRVLDARTCEATAKARWLDVLNAFRDEHKAERQALDWWQEETRIREEDLRNAAINWFTLTGSTNKSVAPGVAIRIVTRVKYDIAKAGACDELVEFIAEPQAAIATDLAKAVGRETPS